MVAQVQTPKRKFVPANLNIADFNELQPLYQQLIERPIGSADELEKWLRDFSELSAAVDEYGSRRYIAKSCHTEDAEIEKAYFHFVENIEPKIKPLYFALQKRYLESPHRRELAMRPDGHRYEILERKWRADVEIYRDENVPIETEITKLVTDYDKTMGAMMVTFRGKEYTLQQLARFIEEPDRATRQEAWELMTRRRLQDRAKIDELFQKLLPMREKLASNAGLPNYRAFVWKAYKRFDYTPDDCERFGAAIEKSVVPLVRKLDEQRAADLQLDRLRPWDLSVDPKNRPPLRPFTDEQVPMLVSKVRTIFDRLSPELATQFDTLGACGNLDLDSRRGKQPGGYQCSLEECGAPFIFMNAAGLQRDVETLLHEGGHAFHCLAVRDEPLVFLRHAPMEFCEVASMAMEGFAADHYDVFYPPADAARAKRTYFEGVIRFFPWMATIDLFQQWIYTHPGHTAEQRTKKWLELMERFGASVDWTGHEDAREAAWQRQLHLFHAPFYYVEYGIAQLGALQLWMKSKEDPRQALAHYRAALKLGGTRPLPKLFETAGIRFDFSVQTLGPLMQAVGEELAGLPS
jgi:oligoendopeptidase F